MHQLSPPEIGAIAEMKFCMAAVEQGFIANVPTVNNRLYDILIDNKHGGFFRVQIKSTAAKARDGSYYIRVGRGYNKTTPYSKQEIDFFACYIYAVDTFYIIPVEEMTSSNKFGLNPNKRDHPRNAYRENWSYFSPSSLSSKQESQIISPE